jgi:hypothetical protein
MGACGRTFGQDGVENPAALSAGLRLVGAGPNPFHGETALRLSLEAPGPVSATAHDAAGALLRQRRFLSGLDRQRASPSNVDPRPGRPARSELEEITR